MAATSRAHSLKGRAGVHPYEHQPHIVLRMGHPGNLRTAANFDVADHA